MAKSLNIKVIRIDGGTQSRVEIDNDVVSDYAQAIEHGDDFPPVIAFHDGADYWLADGFHRYHAHAKAGKASITADVRPGTARDAILFSLSANCAHGLRRTNADKRKAVQTMLADAEWAVWSDRKIAELCGVTQPFVSGIRKPRVITVITPQPGQVVSATTPHPTTAPAKATPLQEPKRQFDAPPPGVQVVTSTDELAEAHHAIADLAAENDVLRDRLAVEVMDASEEEKTQAAETIRNLRTRVQQLDVELAAVKASRDTYMREAAEAKKTAIYWRKKAEKAGVTA